MREGNEERRALEAKAAPDTVFLEASNPVSHNQSALSVITSLTMKDIILLLLFGNGVVIRFFFRQARFTHA